MKKILAMLLAVAMIATLLVGCGKQPATDGGSADAEGGKVTLDVIISQYGNYTQGWWEDFEADFEATNQDIDLVIQIVSWNDIYNVVNTAISTGTQPDILNISGFADYVADDLLMPATEYTSEALQADFIDSFWASNEMDGTVWALPILASCRALFVNTDILTAAGVEAAPTTWDEVLAACEKVKAYDANITPWGLDISTDEGQAAFSYYSWNFGGGYVDADGNWALNSAANVEAVNYMKKLIDSGYCNSDPFTQTRYPLQDMFSAGTLAMMIGPMNMVAADSTVNYEAVNIPGEGIGLGVCDQLMVFKDDKAPDQAARTAAITKFFDAFYEVETYSGYMVYEGFLPATESGSDNLAANAEKYIVGGTEDQTGSSEYFATFCATLPTCSFYPMQKAEWMDVRNGVIEVEQTVCSGAGEAQALLDALQAEVAGE